MYLVYNNVDYNNLVQKFHFFQDDIYIWHVEKNGISLFHFFHCTRINDYLRIGAR